MLKGKLLLATPPLVDPNFDRTVVLVLEHGDDGSLGLVLNRPTDEEVDEMLPTWRPLITGQAVLFDGGPVEEEAIIGLAWVRDLPEVGFADLDEGLGTLDLSEDPDAFDGRVEDLRLFRGYAGWAPGQLEDELAANAWIVVDADRSDPFTPAPDTLWRGPPPPGRLAGPHGRPHPRRRLLELNLRRPPPLPPPAARTVTYSRRTFTSADRALHGRERRTERVAGAARCRQARRLAPFAAAAAMMASRTAATSASVSVWSAAWRRMRKARLRWPAGILGPR